jgi:hypothetical protein
VGGGEGKAEAETETETETETKTELGSRYDPLGKRPPGRATALSVGPIRRNPAPTFYSAGRRHFTERLLPVPWGLAKGRAARSALTHRVGFVHRPAARITRGRLIRGVRSANGR